MDFFKKLVKKLYYFDFGIKKMLFLHLVGKTIYYILIYFYGIQI